MGAKEERFDEIQGVGEHHDWEFLFNFSKVTENAFVTIKLLIFSTSLVIFFKVLFYFFYNTYEYDTNKAYITYNTTPNY